MTHHAAGTFEVKLTPQAPDNSAPEFAIPARMSIDKQFSGFGAFGDSGGFLWCMQVM